MTVHAPLSPAPSSERGISILEIVVVLAIVGSIVAFIAPNAFQIVTSGRENSSQDTLRAMYDGILGDQRTTFGYYGDVGEFPTSLMDLVRDPGVAGWNGPYVDVPPSAIVSNQIVDSFGNPFEFYVLDNVGNLSHRIAIISKGMDGLSTNTSATPNTWTTFAGTLPTSNSYAAGAGNADNLVYPYADGANNDLLLRRGTVGTYAPIVTNFDSNTAVNAAVPACPSLYSMTLTPLGRAADTRTEDVGPISSWELPQGPWQATITSPLASGPVYSQNFTVVPGQAFAPTIPLTGLNSAGTTGFTLQIFHTTGVALQVYINNTLNGTTATNNATTTYANVPGCATIRLQRTGTSTVVDSFTMPYTPYLRNVNQTPRTLTVTNGTLTGTTPPTLNAKDPEVRIYQYVTSTANQVQIGQVPKGRSRTYTVRSRDNIVLTDNAGAVLLTIAAINANRTVSCTSTGCT